MMTREISVRCLTLLIGKNSRPAPLQLVTTGLDPVVHGASSMPHGWPDQVRPSRRMGAPAAGRDPYSASPSLGAATRISWKRRSIMA